MQEWLDAYEDDIRLTSSASTSSSAAATIVTTHDDDHDDDAAVSNNAANVIVVSSSNSSSSVNNDDMQATVNNIDRIWNHTEAMLNQQTFVSALDAACVRYAYDEVVRVLDMSKGEYYVPSSGVLLHILRWVAMASEERFVKTQWYFDRTSIASQYAGKCDIADID